MIADQFFHGGKKCLDDTYVLSRYLGRKWISGEGLMTILSTLNYLNTSSETMIVYDT